MRTNEQKFVTLEDVRIIFRNFSGKPSQYNPPGSRNFCVILDDATADIFTTDGWNVKYLKPRDEGDEPTPYIQVKLQYETEGRPPRVVLVTSDGNTPLDEDSVHTLDWAEIVKADINIRPYNYEVRGSTGVSAYVRDLYVTIEEDELEKRYRREREERRSPRFESIEDDE